MAAGGKPVQRSNADGSVDVWYRGWKLTFPEDGEPRFAKEAPAAGARRATGVKVAGDGLRRGAWLVTFGSGAPKALPVKRRRRDPVWRAFRSRLLARRR